MARSGRRVKRTAPDDGLIQFGEYLRREREMREIPLDEVARETRIGRAFLESIERGLVETLPPLTFVKGFLRAYATYVGLDPNEVLLRFEQALMGKGGLGFREGHVVIGGRRFSYRSLGLPILLVLAAGLLALVLRFIPVDTGWQAPDPLMRKPLSDGSREDPEDLKRRLREQLGLRERSLLQPGLGPTPPAAAAPAPPETPSPSLPAAAGAPGAGPPASASATPSVPTPSPSVAGPTPPATPAAERKHTLVVEGIAPSSYVRVSADAGRARERRIAKGQRETWESREAFQLYLGNAGGVRITLDGQDLGVPGKPGEVLRLTLPQAPETPATPAPAAGGGTDADADAGD